MRFIASKKLALSLIVLMALVMTIAMIIPQKEFRPSQDYQAWLGRYPQVAPVAKNLGLDAIFTSRWFFLLVVMFAVNLGSCTWQQLARVKKQTKSAHPANRSLHLRIIHLWSMPVFHVGLCLIVLGGLVNLGWQMQGYKFLGEGQTFTDGPGEYNRIQGGPLFRDRYAGFQTRLDRVAMDFPLGDTPHFKGAYLSFLEDGRVVQEKVATFGEPVTFRGVMFRPDERGFSALVKFLPAGGGAEELYWSFTTERQPDREVYSNVLNLLRGQYLVRGKFYPNREVFRGKAKGYAPTEPYLDLTIVRGKQVIFMGEIRQGETISFDGNRLQFSKVGYWTSFVVLRNPGVPWVFAGFAVATLGIIGYYTLKPEQEVSN